MKYPANPEMMRRRMERMKEVRGQFVIPAILASESRMNLKAWHGSYWRAGWNLILVHCLRLGAANLYWRLVLRFCDWKGWTKLRPLAPDLPELKTRHGGHCQHYNCSDMDCIEKSVPRWFRKLTRWNE